jgi:hypothetical protein
VIPRHVHKSYPLVSILLDAQAFIFPLCRSEVRVQVPVRASVFYYNRVIASGVGQGFLSAVARGISVRLISMKSEGLYPIILHFASAGDTKLMVTWGTINLLRHETPRSLFFKEMGRGVFG